MSVPKKGRRRSQLIPGELTASDQPLYARVRDCLRKKIAGGDYQVGDNLPTEAELCDTFEASRHTVREALRGLVDLGLIERRQGAGSRVVALAPPQAFVHTVRSLSELWSYTRATKIVVHNSRLVALSSEDAELIGAPPDSRWLRIEALRLIASESDVVCWAKLFVPERYASILEDLGQGSEPVYAIIEARSSERVAEAVQEISACEMPAVAAASLDLESGAPALRVVRRYLDATGRAMLVAVSFHPAESFTHKLRLRRGEEVARREN